MLKIITRVLSVSAIAWLISTADPTRATEAPVITSLKLDNPHLSAGETLKLRFTATSIAGLNLVSGSGIWLGLVVQNAFVNSDAINRSIQSQGDDKYMVEGLKISPYVYTKVLRDFAIQQFYVVDRQGATSSLYASGPDAMFYSDQNGLTKIPVVRFSIADNPNGDGDPAEILSFHSDKSIYRPGESLQLSFSAKDNLSGVHHGCCFGISVDSPMFNGSSAAANGQIRSVGTDLYAVQNIVGHFIKGSE